MARVIKSGKTGASASSAGSSSKTASQTRVVSGSATKLNTAQKVNAKFEASESKVSLDPKTTQLTLKYISPASAARVGFFLSIAMGIIFVVAVSVFWLLLDTSGIIFQFTQALTSSGLGIDISGSFAIGKVVLVTSILACVNVVLITIFSMICAAIYNAAARLSGGLKMYFTR
ncbi:hypothetical protein FACS1894125_0880 [Actinomycetota bacterium]|nr:hypothetical protein FACS1894125_0880 [Actinomycetota bacterium]